MKDTIWNNIRLVWQVPLLGLAMLSSVLLLLSPVVVQAQVKNLRIHLSDGTVVRYNLATIDSLTIEDIPQWANRSEEARRLLSYMQENTGQKMLTGTMACVNYNTNEADWVYKHTGKYPAINCIDFIHDIYSGSWIDYGSTTLWRGWTNKRGIMAAMWHWGMPTNDGEGYTCTPGEADDETGFKPSAIFEPESDGYKTMMARIDQIAEWLKPLATARIPVLWRPLHEAQGNWSEQAPGVSWHKAWFWWGIDGPEAFVELWRVMYERMVDHHGLTNLIWVFTAGDSKRWYPGDEYVDIVGYDFYNASLEKMHTWYDIFQQTYPGKLYAISECGSIPYVSELWEDGQYWNYFMPWYDYDRTSKPSDSAFGSTEHSNADIDWWKDALQQDFVITRDELPNFR